MTDFVTGAPSRGEAVRVPSTRNVVIGVPVRDGEFTFTNTQTTRTDL
jgi:hypothetical protein